VPSWPTQLPLLGRYCRHLHFGALRQRPDWLSRSSGSGIAGLDRFWVMKWWRQVLRRGRRCEMGDCGGTWRWVDTFTNGNKEQENRNKKWNDRVGAKGTISNVGPMSPLVGCAKQVGAVVANTLLCSCLSCATPNWCSWAVRDKSQKSC
jgi:hypothetical protein